MKGIYKDTSVLFSSNLIAQAVSLILIILVCRNYYTPEELEKFTLFQSAINFFGILFFLKLDTLFFIEKEKSNRDLIYQFAGLTIVFFSILFFITNIVFSIYRLGIFLESLLLIGIILFGYFNISQIKLINENKFFTASITRITFPFVNLIVTLLLIYLGFKSHAMFIGLLTGLLIALLIQYIHTRAPFAVNWIKIKELLKFYKKDLLFSNFIFVVNSFRDSLFLLFISYYYSQKEFVASYSQGLRIGSLPALVLAGAIGSVVGARLKTDTENKDLFKKNYFKVLFTICSLSIIIFTLAYLLMDWGVEFLFSDKWSYTSECAKALIPWLITNFVLNALGAYFLVLRMQFINFIINIFDVAFFLFVFFLFGSNYEFEQTLALASVISGFFGLLSISVLSIKVVKFAKKVI